LRVDHPQDTERFHVPPPPLLIPSAANHTNSEPPDQKLNDLVQQIHAVGVSAGSAS